MFHDRPRSTVGADWKAAADNLPKRRDVGLEGKQRLRTPVADAETSDDLITDEHGATACRKSADSVEELPVRYNHAHVARDGLHDHGGNFLSVEVKHGIKRRHIVVRCDERRTRCSLGYAGTRGDAQGKTPAAGARE